MDKEKEEISPEIDDEGRVSETYSPSSVDIFDELLEEEATKEELEAEIKIKKEEREEKDEKEEAGEKKSKKRKSKIKVVKEKEKAEKEITKEEMDREANDLSKEEGELIQPEEKSDAETVEKEDGIREEGIKEKLGKEEIMKTILEKAGMASEGDKAKVLPGTRLNFLEDKEKGNVFIGMKKGVYKKYGHSGALFVGKVDELDYKDNNVFLDSLNPHIIFICGARGSGKSYDLGIIAEELALKNRNVGTIVIDPIGIFWSMKFPNREEREIKNLAKWGLTPQGLDNMKVFVPEGVKKSAPKSTYDSGFSLQPSLLTADDWCLTFGIDRFSPTGLLVDKTLQKAEKGYRQIESGKYVKAKGKNYGLDDLIECLATDSELNSREKGYKADSIRALISRFDGAKAWGIFSEKGTPLSELSREGQLTILDTSFLEDNVTALIIGILARRILTARKISTRKEAASKFKAIDIDELLELEIPPTWLLIDEAHTLIPSGTEKTPATSGLVEYVKQGRRPGCSLVLATQQPSAIDTKVLSQLDLIITHKLIFDDDIKAVYKRTPTIIPKTYKSVSFIKTIPVGAALVGDRREETSRAFVMKIRPRMSQHEGRDAETLKVTRKLDEGQVKMLAVEIILKDLEKEQEIEIKKIDKLLAALNSKYKTKTKLSGLLDGLEKKGVTITPESVRIEPGEIEEMLEEEAKEIVQEEAPKEEISGDVLEKTELLSLPARISRRDAERIVNGQKRKKFLGILGESEDLKQLELDYCTVWRVKYDVFIGGKEFIARECFIDSSTGEFIHFIKGNFVLSKGLREFYEMSEDKIKVLELLRKDELMVEEIIHRIGFSEGKVRRILQTLINRQLVGVIAEKKTRKKMYWCKGELDLPPNERHELLSSLNNLPFVRVEAIAKQREKYSRDLIPELLKKMWKKVLVRDIGEVYRPVWDATLELKGRERKIRIDAVTGKII